MSEENVIGNQIVLLRTSHGYTQDDLAKLLGYSKQTISNWETGLKTPRMGAIQKLSDFFNVNKSYIIEGTNSSDKLLTVYNQLNGNRQENVYKYASNQLEEQNKVVQMPTTNTVEVYGAVSAGTGEYLTDNQPEEVDYNGTVPEHDFAVTVNGDSMTPLFDDKQIIFVKKAHEARSGQIVIADYDGQAYVKKFVADDNGCRLVSLNKKYHDLPIDEEHEMSLFGIVVL